jgi:hypothetical protein
MTEALANFCDKKTKANHKSEFLLDKGGLKERSRKSEQKLTMIAITFPIKKKKKTLVKYIRVQLGLRLSLLLVTSAASSERQAWLQLFQVPTGVSL